ncbi:hypothetical protein [Aquabacterium sp.]|uniref:hypothetical protein n=1 Tax=Aquabacterium sp. TaxID=1872578 RepID=UPI002E310C39|nr:hypothetical protein [Aquabacterium sp.]HEX5312501.1 hypothetical protein [Aquabacterium sp.]
MDSTHLYTEDDLALFRKLFDGKKTGDGIRPSVVDPLFVRRHANVWFKELGSMLVLTRRGAEILQETSRLVEAS